METSWIAYPIQITKLPAYGWPGVGWGGGEGFCSLARLSFYIPDHTGGLWIIYAGRLRIG